MGEIADNTDRSMAYNGRTPGLAQGIVLSLATFLPVMATVSLSAAMPRFFEQFGAVPHRDLLIPMLITLPAVSIAVLSPVAGAWVGRLGRRRVLIYAVILYGLCGTAPLYLEALPAILVSRVGVGVSEAMLMTSGKTLTGDYFQGPVRQKWIGYQGAIDAACGTLTWYLGGVLASLGWRGPFLLYFISVPLFVGVIFLIWEPATAAPVAGTPRQAVRPFPWRTMLGIYAITLFTGLMYFSYPVNIANALSKLGAGSERSIGFLTAIASIGTPVGALVFGRAHRLRSAVLLSSALVLIGIAYLGIGTTRSYLTATTFGFVEQIGNGIAGATLTMWCLNALPFEYRGRGMGWWSTFLIAGIFLSPIAFSLIAKVTGGLGGGFVTLGILCVVAAIFLPLVKQPGLILAPAGDAR